MSRKLLFRFRQTRRGRDSCKIAGGLKRFGKNALDKPLDAKSLLHRCQPVRFCREMKRKIIKLRFQAYCPRVFWWFAHRDEIAAITDRIFMKVSNTAAGPGSLHDKLLAAWLNTANCCQNGNCLPGFGFEPCQNRGFA